jgi:hypothetical protein
MVGDKAYGYTLWRRRPGHLLGDKAEASGDWFFDRADRNAMTAVLIELVDRHGKDGNGLDGYRLELLDPVTREHVCTVTPLEPAPLNGAQYQAPFTASLEDVSDERLLAELARISHELARRLRRR